MPATRIFIAILAANLCTAAVIYVGYCWHVSSKTKTTVWEENMAQVIIARKQIEFGVYKPSDRMDEKIAQDRLLLEIEKTRPTFAPADAFLPEILQAQTEIASSK